MGSRSSFLLVRIRGIPVRIHATFLLVLPFLAYTLGKGLADAARRAGAPPGQLGGTPWLWGLALTVALFLSVLVHELAHSLYAVSHGGKVRSITLHMLGGVSELAAPPRSEALMALAGPATSLALGGILLVLARLGSGAVSPNARAALSHLGELNVALGVFNLLPAFPMDGGRILRGALARKLGLAPATRIAARLGRAFAILFAAAGFLTLDVLLLLVSFVIHVGAEGEARAVLLREALGDLRVRDFMSPLDGAVSADETLLAVGDRMIHDRRTAFPVSDGGRIVGFVTADALRRVAPEQRGRTRAREVVRAAAVVPAAERLADACRLFGDAVFPELAVIDDGRIVGTLSERDVARGLELRDVAHAAGAAGSSRPAT